MTYFVCTNISKMPLFSEYKKRTHDFIYGKKKTLVGNVEEKKLSAWETANWLEKIALIVKCNLRALLVFSVVLFIVVSAGKFVGQGFLKYKSDWDVIILPGLQLVSYMLAAFSIALFEDSRVFYPVAILLSFILIMGDRASRFDTKYKDVLADTGIIVGLAFSFTLLDFLFRKYFMKSVDCGEFLPLSQHKKELRDKKEAKEKSKETSDE